MFPTWQAFETDVADAVAIGGPTFEQGRVNVSHELAEHLYEAWWPVTNSFMTLEEFEDRVMLGRVHVFGLPIRFVTDTGVTVEAIDGKKRFLDYPITKPIERSHCAALSRQEVLIDRMLDGTGVTL